MTVRYQNIFPFVSSIPGEYLYVAIYVVITGGFLQWFDDWHQKELADIKQKSLNFLRYGYISLNSPVDGRTKYHCWNNLKNIMFQHWATFLPFMVKTINYPVAIIMCMECQGSQQTIMKYRP